MIEYLYNAIRATAGENICIAAKITDDNGELVNVNSHLMIYDDALITSVPGVFDGEVWSYHVPGIMTEGKKGKYWYCICTEDASLSFKQPIYLI